MNINSTNKTHRSRLPVTQDNQQKSNKAKNKISNFVNKIIHPKSSKAGGSQVAESSHNPSEQAYDVSQDRLQQNLMGTINYAYRFIGDELNRSIQSINNHKDWNSSIALVKALPENMQPPFFEKLASSLAGLIQKSHTNGDWFHSSSALAQLPKEQQIALYDPMLNQLQNIFTQSGLSSDERAHAKQQHIAQLQAKGLDALCVMLTYSHI